MDGEALFMLCVWVFGFWYAWKDSEIEELKRKLKREQNARYRAENGTPWREEDE